MNDATYPADVSQERAMLEAYRSEQRTHIFIDDYKGNDPGKPDAPRAFMARAFHFQDLATGCVDIFRLLNAEHAWDWHGSRRGKPAFHRSTAFYDILGALDASSSTLYIVSTFQDLLSQFLPEIREQANDLFAAFKIFWPIMDDNQAMLLATFVVRVSDIALHYERDRWGDSARHLLFIVDGIDAFQSPFSKANVRAKQHPHGPVTVGRFQSRDGRVQVTVGSMPNKEEGHFFYRSGLALIDGESWVYHYPLKYQPRDPALRSFEQSGRLFKELKSAEERATFSFNDAKVLADMEANTHPELYPKVRAYEQLTKKWRDQGRFSIHGNLMSGNDE